MLKTRSELRKSMKQMIRRAENAMSSAYELMDDAQKLGDQEEFFTLRQHDNLEDAKNTLREAFKLAVKSQK